MQHITPVDAVRRPSPVAGFWNRVIRLAVAGVLLAALGTGFVVWYLSQSHRDREDAQARARNDALYGRMLAALAYVVPEGGGKSGCGVLVDQQERLVVASTRLMGENTRARVTFAHADPAGMPAQTATTADVLFCDTTRSLVLLRLRELPSGAAALPLGDWTPSTTMTLHSLRSSQSASPSAQNRSWSCCQGKIERILMIPHY
jgi:hypothetical protein